MNSSKVTVFALKVGAWLCQQALSLLGGTKLVDTAKKQTQLEEAVELPAYEPGVELPAQAQVSPEQKENNVTASNQVQRPNHMETPQGAVIGAETPEEETTMAAIGEEALKGKDKEDTVENKILSRQFRHSLWLLSQSLTTMGRRGYEDMLGEALAAYPILGMPALQAVLPYTHEGLRIGSLVALEVRRAYEATGRAWAKEFFAFNENWLHGEAPARATALQKELFLNRGRLNNDKEAREAAKAARRAVRREARKAAGLRVLKLTPEQRLLEWAPKNGAASLSVQLKHPKGLPVVCKAEAIMTRLSPEQKLARRVEILALRKERSAARKKSAVDDKGRGRPRLNKAGIPQSQLTSHRVGRVIMTPAYKQTEMQRKAANMGFETTLEYIEYTRAVKSFKDQAARESAERKARADERKARAELRAAKRMETAEKRRLFVSLKTLKASVTIALKAATATAMAKAEKLILESLAVLKELKAEPRGQLASDLALMGFVA